MKKFYSTISNALLMSISDNGDSAYWEYQKLQNNAEQIDVFLNKYLFPYLVGIVRCSYYDSKKQGLCKQLSHNLIPSSYYDGPVYVFEDGGCFTIYTGGVAVGQSVALHIKYDLTVLENQMKITEIFLLL